MNWQELLGGLAVGSVLGFINSKLLAWTVRKSVNYSQGKALFLILCSYILRYVTLAILVVWLFGREKNILALSLLAGLVIMTQFFAIRNRLQAKK